MSRLTKRSDGRVVIIGLKRHITLTTILHKLADYEDEAEQKENGCDFCNSYDFGRAKTNIDDDGANILLSLCNTKFSKEEQFKYCPVCGRKLGD